jgi:cytochrome c-type biogenesis protein CcmH
VTAPFWVVAALLCAVAVLILLVPVVRHRRRGGRWSLEGIVVAVLIAPLALALYSSVSNWDPELAARTNREGALLEQLLDHLETNPNDLDGWRLLAASYMQLGRYDQARAAYQRVWALTRQPDDELKIAYAESQILADRAALTGEAGRLVGEVLATSPGDPKALWYGGWVALELGRDDAVRMRWTSLLALNPPEDVARIVESQLAGLGGAASASGR